MGIYGFLSAAYQETSNKAGIVDSQISLIETKRDNIKEQLSVYIEEKESINKAVADLRTGLANNVIQYTNAEGQLITTTSSSTRRALEKQLDQATERQTEINSKVDELNTKLFDYETEIVEVSANSELAGELGPLKYLSGLTGMPMDKIINILLLTIIFVFDPLAIALVIAANFAFAQLRPKKEYPLEEQVEDMRKVVDTYDTLQDEIEDNEGTDIYTEEDLSDWDSTLSDGLEDEEWDKEEELNEKFKKASERYKELEDAIKSSSLSSWRKGKELNELEKQFDINGDGILDNEENARLNYYKRLQTLKNKGNDNQITY
jgi:chromosome segregation ATPase